MFLRTGGELFGGEWRGMHGRETLQRDGMMCGRLCLHETVQTSPARVVRVPTTGPLYSSSQPNGQNEENPRRGF